MESSFTKLSILQKLSCSLTGDGVADEGSCMSRAAVTSQCCCGNGMYLNLVIIRSYNDHKHSDSITDSNLE